MSAAGSIAQGAGQGIQEGQKQIQDIFKQELLRRQEERANLDSASNRMVQAQQVRVSGSREARDQQAFAESLKPFNEAQTQAIAKPLGVPPITFEDLPRSEAIRLAQIFGAIKAAQPSGRANVLNNARQALADQEDGITFMIRQLDSGLKDTAGFFENALRIGLTDEALANFTGVPLHILAEAKLTGNARAIDAAAKRKLRAALIKKRNAVQDARQRLLSTLGVDIRDEEPTQTKQQGGSVMDMIGEGLLKGLQETKEEGE